MFGTHRRVVAVSIIAALLSIGTVSVASAQSTSTPDATGTTTKAEMRATHKATRKAHRAAKNAELSKLEKGGYKPNAKDPSYPNKLQAAEKSTAGK